MAQKHELPGLDGSQGDPGLTGAERRRSKVSGLKEAHEVSDEAIAQWLSFLHAPRNRIHFADTPTIVEGVRSYVSKPEHLAPEHLLLAVNAAEEVLGGAIIEDARPRQHDHFISLFVVDPEKQRRGIGTDMMRKLLDWSATTLTYDGRQREKIDLAIIDVEGWKRMENLIIPFGFNRVSLLRRQVDVNDPDSETWDRKATRRYELYLDNWRIVRGIHAPVPVPTPASRLTQ